MRLGSPFSAGLGSPENMVEYCLPELAADQTSVRLRFKPRAGWGDAFFAVFMDARQVAHLWCAEAAEQSVRCALPWGTASASFLALRVGRLADPSLDLRRVARTFESDSRKVSLDLPFVPEVLGAVKGEDDWLWCDNWVLTGLDFLRNVTPLKPFKTRAYLELDLAVAGGNVTVTLSKGGVAVAAGTGAVGGTVALAEENGSGLSGSVDVDAAVEATADARLYVRWPAKIQVLRGASSPPTVVVANVAFNGSNLRRWTEAADLAVGTWYYRARTVSDTGEVGAATDLSFTILDVPAAPAALAYKSGNAARTILQFTPSPTSGATYRAYLQKLGAALMDLETIAAEAQAGAEEIVLPCLFDLPAGIALWLKADAITGLEDGDPVALWPDSSGNGHDAYRNDSYKPVYDAVWENGLPAVYFGGANCLNLPAFLDAGGFEAFLVAAGSGCSLLWLFDPSENHRGGPDLWSAIASCVYGPGGLVDYFGLSSDPFAQKHVLSSRYAGTHDSHQLSVDGVLQTKVGGASADPGLFEAGVMGYLGYGAPWGLLTGRIAEVVVYDRALSAAERQAVESYLMLKYAIGAPAGQPGVARAVLRAVKAGLEERNLDTLALEYDAAGAFVPARPNPAELCVPTEVVTDGLTLDVVATYDPAREKGVATHVHLYQREPGGSYGESPDAWGDLTQAANGLKEAALALTFGADGWYYVQARAATAANIESPAADCPEYLVYVCDDAPPAPDAEGQVSRG